MSLQPKDKEEGEDKNGGKSVRFAASPSPSSTGFQRSISFNQNASNTNNTNCNDNSHNYQELYLQALRDLGSEKQQRKRKEKNIIKLAQELHSQTLKVKQQGELIKKQQAQLAENIEQASKTDKESPVRILQARKSRTDKLEQLQSKLHESVGSWDDLLHSLETKNLRIQELEQHNQQNEQAFNQQRQEQARLEEEKRQELIQQHSQELAELHENHQQELKKANKIAQETAKQEMDKVNAQAAAEHESEMEVLKVQHEQTLSKATESYQKELMEIKESLQEELTRAQTRANQLDASIAEMIAQHEKEKLEWKENQEKELERVQKEMEERHEQVLQATKDKMQNDLELAQTSWAQQQEQHAHDLMQKQEQQLLELQEKHEQELSHATEQARQDAMDEREKHEKQADEQHQIEIEKLQSLHTEALSEANENNRKESLELTTRLHVALEKAQTRAHEQEAQVSSLVAQREMENLEMEKHDAAAVELRSSMQLLQQDMQELEKENKHLETELNSSKVLLAESQGNSTEELRDAQKLLEEKDDRISELCETIESLHDDIETVNTKMVNTAQLEEERRKFELRVDELSRQIDSFHTQKSTLEHAVKTSNKALAEQKGLVKELEDDLQTREALVLDQGNRIASMKEELRMLREENHSTSGDNVSNHLEEVIRNLEELAELRERRIEDLTESQISLGNQIRELQNDASVHMDSTTENENAPVPPDDDSSRHESNIERPSEEDLHARLKDREARVTELEDLVPALQKQLEMFEQESLVAKSNGALSEQPMPELKESFEQLEQDLKQRNVRIGELQEALAMKEFQMSTLKEEVALLSARLEQTTSGDFPGEAPLLGTTQVLAPSHEASVKTLENDIATRDHIISELQDSVRYLERQLENYEQKDEYSTSSNNDDREREQEAAMSIMVNTHEEIVERLQAEVENREARVVGLQESVRSLQSQVESYEHRNTSVLESVASNRVSLQSVKEDSTETSGTEKITETLWQRFRRISIRILIWTILLLCIFVGAFGYHTIRNSLLDRNTWCAPVPPGTTQLLVGEDQSFVGTPWWKKKAVAVLDMVTPRPLKAIFNSSQDSNTDLIINWVERRLCTSSLAGSGGLNIVEWKGGLLTVYQNDKTGNGRGKKLWQKRATGGALLETDRIVLLRNGPGNEEVVESPWTKN